MRSTVIILVFFVLYCAKAEINIDDPNLTDDDAFELFKILFGKTYSSPEVEAAYKRNFIENRLIILTHKPKYMRNEIGYDIGMNKFGDLNRQQFNARYKGLLPKKKSSSPLISQSQRLRAKRTVPESLDYHDQGIVYAVKDQGGCAACYSFAVIAGLESQVAKLNGGLHSLSDQQAVDCSFDANSTNPVYKNIGCDGGYIEGTANYFRDNGGVNYEPDYPYVIGATKKPGMCAYKEELKSKAIVHNYIPTKSGDENDLQQALFTVGPITVAIDASKPSFQLYLIGIYYEPLCSSTELDHAVLLIGYGYSVLKQQKYWIVKNQWGTSWGMQGYMWMSRDQNNNCGIATNALYLNVSLAP